MTSLNSIIIEAESLNFTEKGLWSGKWKIFVENGGILLQKLGT